MLGIAELLERQTSHGGFRLADRFQHVLEIDGRVFGHLEDPVRLMLNGGLEPGMQPIAGCDVHGDAQLVLKHVLDRRHLDQGKTRSWIVLDKDIDIALRPGLTSPGGAKQIQRGRSQVSRGGSAWVVLSSSLLHPGKAAGLGAENPPNSPVQIRRATSVDWRSTYGIGGSLSLILAMIGVTAIVLFRRRNAGIWFLVTAIGIWLMPSLLNTYLGIGKFCGA